MSKIMDDSLPEAEHEMVVGNNLNENPNISNDELLRLRDDFQSRLVAANLRTEAVRAGMIDLDGLKLVDLSDVRLDDDDKIIGGRKMMTELRRAKPWLFGTGSSSSVAIAPTLLPARQKTAMDMTDEEYAAARTMVTKYQI